MKKVKYTISALALAATLSAPSIYADTIAIGPKIGTQGIGLDARLPVAENIFARIGGNYFRHSHSFNKSQVDFKGRITLMTVPVMIDLHPFNNSGFKVSLGAAYNGNKVTAHGKATKPVTVSGRTYSPSEVGNVDAKLKLGNSVGGIVSFGYDNSFISGSALSFNFEAGAMYTGKAKLKVSTSTPLQTARQKQMLDDLKRDADKALDKIQKYLKLYPILSVGIRYSF